MVANQEEIADRQPGGQATGGVSQYHAARPRGERDSHRARHCLEPIALVEVYPAAKGDDAGAGHGSDRHGAGVTGHRRLRQAQFGKAGHVSQP